MASEDQDILAKIGQLAGQINRHKNAQGPSQQSQYPAMNNSSYTRSAYQSTPGYNQYNGFQARGRYPTRGYGRGGRVAPIHRHRSLVLNGNTSTTSNDHNTQATLGDEPSNPVAPLTNTGGSWVSKNDRHRQLINSSIYEKESQKRAKAIEETWKQRLKQRDDREKAKFNKHLRTSSQNAGSNNPDNTGRQYEINVQGISFRVANNGSKLVKVSGDSNAAKATPKIATIGGVKFYRTKNGNMYRSGIIKAHGKPRTIKKIDEPCKMFTTTGSCLNGPRCRYTHDPSKVAVCKDFLQKGNCPSGDSCDLSHDLTPERTPTCMHFSKGNCSNPSCRYMHIRVSPSALVCRAFGIYGYCEKGANCTDRHLHECPDFSNTGACTTPGCKLLHRHKASVMRTNTTRSDEDETSDISSDEDGEEIDSDDVDSDDLDGEFFGDEDGMIDSDLPAQKDFVRL